MSLGAFETGPEFRDSLKLELPFDLEEFASSVEHAKPFYVVCCSVSISFAAGVGLCVCLSFSFASKQWICLLHFGSNGLHVLVWSKYRQHTIRCLISHIVFQTFRSRRVLKIRAPRPNLPANNQTKRAKPRRFWPCDLVSLDIHRLYLTRVHLLYFCSCLCVGPTCLCLSHFPCLKYTPMIICKRLIVCAHIDVCASGCSCAPIHHRMSVFCYQTTSRARIAQNRKCVRAERTMW